MPNVIKKLTTFAKSPEASSAIAKARAQVAKPENKRRIEQLKARISKRG